MSSPLLAALQDARAALNGATSSDAVESAVVRRCARELDEAITRLSGQEPEKDLVSIVCHDLKDPLASIVMGAGFLKRTMTGDDASARRVIEAIGRSADRMGHVIGDFHDLAKLQSGRLQIDPKPCDAGAVVSMSVSAHEGQARERNVRLTFENGGGHVRALCDRARLEQIVGKLVGNALRFTGAEGRVVVRVEADAQSVRVSVTDSGRGISPERLPSIFDYAANARRAPRDGPGLGLAIVRGLVELQRGQVSVESTVGEGSTFTFALPRA